MCVCVCVCVCVSDPTNWHNTVTTIVNSQTTVDQYQARRVGLSHNLHKSKI